MSTNRPKKREGTNESVEHSNLVEGERPPSNVESEEKSGVVFETVTTAAPDLDPHLQQVVMSKGQGRLVDPEVLTETPEGATAVDVLAKLKDPAEPVDGLSVVQTIGDIVTGTVDLDKIEAVRRHPNVVSLKRATRLHQDLRFSVPEIRADVATLRTTSPTGNTIDGSGVVVGIVDYGCDFLHRNFRKVDGTSRLLFLWDQNAGRTSSSPKPYNYGREYTAAQINAAIQQASPSPLSNDPIYAQIKFPEDPNNRAYLTLGYGPEPTPITEHGAGNHGTHVMDIAAGNGRGSGVPGVAPGADLIFVEVSAGDVVAEESFGNSRRLLEAVTYIFEKAEQLGRPCVINLSLGTHGGPHDGSTLAEQAFDTLLSKPGRAIVISAGNSWERRSHASGRVAPTSPRTLTWQIGRRNQFGQLVDPTGNELEVWYPGTSAMDVTLVSPDGQRIGPTKLGQRTEIRVGGAVHGLVIHRRSDPNNGDNQIDLLLSPSLPKGDWQVVLAADGEDVDFHAWIERDDRGQSRFAPQDDDPTHTIGSISCGLHTLTVGSYDARSPQKDLSSFTSEGPTRDGKQKPEISAPGHAILAAWSLTHNRVTSMSGTSMAAPHVTGLVALLMQAAGETLTATQIREAVMSASRAMAHGEWHPRYGAGRIDCEASIKTTVALGREEGTVEQPVPSAPAEPLGGNDASLDEMLSALTRVAVERRARIRLEIEIQPPGV